jgi:hypothetical protein
VGNPSFWFYPTIWRESSSNSSLVLRRGVRQWQIGGCLGGAFPSTAAALVRILQRAMNDQSSVA